MVIRQLSLHLRDGGKEAAQTVFDKYFDDDLRELIGFGVAIRDDLLPLLSSDVGHGLGGAEERKVVGELDEAQKLLAQVREGLVSVETQRLQDAFIGRDFTRNTVKCNLVDGDPGVLMIIG